MSNPSYLMEFLFFRLDEHTKGKSKMFLLKKEKIATLEQKILLTEIKRLKEQRPAGPQKDYK